MAFVRGISMGVNRENAGLKSLKSDSNPPVTQRAALGDIGNKVKSFQHEDGLKGLKKVDDSKHELKPKKASHPVLKKALKPYGNVMSKAEMSEKIDQVTESFSTQQLAQIEDIDKGDEHNPQLVPDLVNDIYDYLRHMENKYVIRPNYLKDKQIQPKMRAILVDWLIQVHNHFKLLQETLYMTIGILDRFLQDHDVSRQKLQLVGVTSMYIAAKYEEIHPPAIQDFVYITDNAYTLSDIRRMECVILSKLNFEFGRPLPLHFLRRNSKAGDANVTMHTLAKYVMELTVLDYEMVHYPPSQIAAAAFCLSIKVAECMRWDETMTYYSKYSENDLKPIMRKISKLIVRADHDKQQAVRTKYASSRYMKISCLPELHPDYYIKFAVMHDII